MEYRLEFSEEQQCFHMEFKHKENENSNGFITVMPSCSDNEKNLLKSFLYRNEKEGASGIKIVKYRHADVLEAVDEVKGFLRNLEEFNIELKYN